VRSRTTERGQPALGRGWILSAVENRSSGPRGGRLKLLLARRPGDSGAATASARTRAIFGAALGEVNRPGLLS
jgi:hypothetical protein